MSTTKPKPRQSVTKRAPLEEITTSEGARRLGLTAQSIGQWTARPGAPVRPIGNRMMIEWPAFARWREQEMVSKAKADATPPTLSDALTRKAVAQARLAEMDAALREGELVTLADYETALGRVLDHLMAALRAMPVRLSHLGPEAEAAVEAEAERVITALQNFDEDVIEDEPEPETES